VKTRFISTEYPDHDVEIVKKLLINLGDFIAARRTIKYKKFISNIYPVMSWSARLELLVAYGAYLATKKTVKNILARWMCHRNSTY
jgi:hypothetical protein